MPEEWFQQDVRSAQHLYVETGVISQVLEQVQVQIEPFKYSLFNGFLNGLGWLLDQLTVVYGCKVGSA